jgi:hypothetical protein
VNSAYREGKNAFAHSVGVSLSTVVRCLVQIPEAKFPDSPNTGL